MEKKDKAIASAIIIALIVAVILFVKFSPVWVSLVSAGTLILGGLAGYCVKYIKDKYFPR